MSASVTLDIMTLLERLGFGHIGRGIYDPLTLQIRKPVHGILVEQRTTAPAPDAICGDDTVYVNIQVRGEGRGEVGRDDAHRVAMRIFRALDLRLDLLINGTYYELITPDSSPYEVRDGEHCDVLLGLQVVRYYRGDMSPEDFERPLPPPSDGYERYGP